ncbi:hypothetical protein [Kitasatospora brasiliensis]|uniref:hypothetical protein n=1 Tax=Kitasatospora brasiliensis TaxID=3058040 RepID=UPI002930BD35|nr:hypothetical protein [Kitasatospora sp. K002]
MTVGRRRISTSVPGSPMNGASRSFVSFEPFMSGAAGPALTVRRYIDHALVCSACCR